MEGIDGYKVHHRRRLWHVRVRHRRDQQQLANLPGRNLAISVHLLPRRFCALQMAKSSSADQGSRFIDGSNWFLKRSRHCLPVRPGSCPAMTAHFRRPWTVTSCLISSSSCQIEHGADKKDPGSQSHPSLHSPATTVRRTRCTMGRDTSGTSYPSHLLRPGLATQIKGVVVSLIVVFRARDGRVQHVLFGHLQAACLGMSAYVGLLRTDMQKVRGLLYVSSLLGSGNRSEHLSKTDFITVAFPTDLMRSPVFTLYSTSSNFVFRGRTRGMAADSPLLRRVMLGVLCVWLFLATCQAINAIPRLCFSQPQPSWGLRPTFRNPCPQASARGGGGARFGIHRISADLYADRSLF